MDKPTATNVSYSIIGTNERLGLYHIRINAIAPNGDLLDFVGHLSFDVSDDLKESLRMAQILADEELARRTQNRSRIPTN